MLRSFAARDSVRVCIPLVPHAAHRHFAVWAIKSCRAAAATLVAGLAGIYVAVAYSPPGEEIVAERVDDCWSSTLWKVRPQLCAPVLHEDKDEDEDEDEVALGAIDSIGGRLDR